MKRWIIGGVITLILGGTTYKVSQSSIVNNFSKNTGLSQQQAQQFVNNIPQKDLASFSKIGQSLVSDGNAALSDASSIDCTNYTYQWVTASLSCQDGVNQFQTAGNDEITLGNCYESLNTNLGNSSKSTINECISDSDMVTSDYNLPIIITLLDSKSIIDSKDAVIYDKSILQAALQSNQ